MRVALIRHPKPAIGRGVCYGRLDIGIAPGFSADMTLWDLRDFEPKAVIASPARRCRKLASAIAEFAGVSPVYDERLLELDFGDWEGQRWDSLPREAMDRWAADPISFAPPGGESGASLIGRVSAVAAELTEDTVIVAHAGPLKLLPALIQGRKPDLLAPSPAFASVVWSKRLHGHTDHG